MVPVENDKPTVIALREIAAGFIDASILDDSIKPEDPAEIIIDISQDAFDLPRREF